MSGRRLAVALPSPAPPRPPPPPPPPPIGPFDLSEPGPSPSLASLVSSDFVRMARYRCCCRIMHLKTASFIIGIVDTLSMAAAFGRGLHLGLSMQHNPMAIAWFVISSLMFVLGFVCTLTMFYGIWRERYLWIVPKLVLKISAVILYSATTVGLVYVMMEHSQYLLDLVAEHITKSDYEAAKAALRTGGGGLVVAFLLMALIHIWFFFVLYRSYKYLKDRYFWKKSRLSTAECNANYTASLFPSASPALSTSSHTNAFNSDSQTYANTNGNIRPTEGAINNESRASSEENEVNRFPLHVPPSAIQHDSQCNSPFVLQSRSDRELLLCGRLGQSHV